MFFIGKNLIKVLCICSIALTCDTYADLCGTTFTVAQACDDANDCSDHILFDRQSVSFSGGWSTVGGRALGEGWNFELAFDNVAQETMINGSSSQISFSSYVYTRGAVNGAFLVPGRHSVKSTLNTLSNKNCTKTTEFSVEATQIFGGISDSSKVNNSSSQVLGAACIKGLNTNRLMKSTAVDLYVGFDQSKLKKITSSSANLVSNNLPAVNQQCNSTSVGFNIQLSERQMADYCNQKLWAVINNPDASRSYLSGSGVYTVPCALRPFVDSVYYPKGYSPQVIGLTGSNFVIGTKVDIYDADGSLWKTVPVAFGGPSSVSFQLPSDVPPTGCNATKSCRLWVGISNPDGLPLGVFSAFPIDLSPQPQPKVVSYNLDQSSYPWKVKISGQNFGGAAQIELYDGNSSWGSVSASSDNTSVSFTLPEGYPPSKCNQVSSCSITVKINVPYGKQFATVSTGIVLTKLPQLPPVIYSSGATGAFPQKVWLTGVNFVPNGYVTLQNCNRTQSLFVGVPYTFIDSNNITFQVPASYLSGCPLGRGQDMPVVYEVVVPPFYVRANGWTSVLRPPNLRI